MRCGTRVLITSMHLKAVYIVSIYLTDVKVEIKND